MQKTSIEELVNYLVDVKGLAFGCELSNEVEEVKPIFDKEWVGYYDYKEEQKYSCLKSFATDDDSGFVKDVDYLDKETFKKSLLELTKKELDKGKKISFHVGNLRLKDSESRRCRLPLDFYTSAVLEKVGNEYTVKYTMEDCNSNILVIDDNRQKLIEGLVKSSYDREMIIREYTA